MNYRHIFHAGNVVDVVKHASFSLVLEALRQKEKGFFVLDTHAGTGLYDLTDPRALKTGEATLGIQRLVQAPMLPELTSYLAALARFNPGWAPGAPIRFYPGSPFLAAVASRGQDRVLACEKHVEDASELKRRAKIFSQLHVHERDGYEGLRAFLPPKEKRGVILIDPPFEEPQEMEHLPANIARAARLWPEGQILVWYPIKERPAIWRFFESVRRLELRVLSAEFIYQPETRSDRLNGCGLILVNPAWQIDLRLQALFPGLHDRLGTAHRGVAIEWLSGER